MIKINVIISSKNKIMIKNPMGLCKAIPLNSFIIPKIIIETIKTTINLKSNTLILLDTKIER